MAKREVEFSIVARDEASRIFQKVGGSVDELREKMNLPIVGPLSPAQQQTAMRAMNKTIAETMVKDRMAAMEAAAIRHNLQEQVEEMMFGKPKGPLRTVTRSADEQMFRDMMAQRVKSMRDTARKGKVAEQVQEALFGTPKGPLRKVRRDADEQVFRDMKARRLKEMREGARVENATFRLDVEMFGSVEAKAKAAERAFKGAKSEARGFLDIIKKLGTSNGLDAPLEMLSRMAPMLGAGLAITKAGTMVAQGITFGFESARHNRQNNLERQLADDQRREAFLTSIPIVGEAGRAIADLPPEIGEAFRAIPGIGNLVADKIGERFNNLAAIEGLEDATKAQDKYTERLARRAALEKSLIENAKASNVAMKLQFDQRGTAAERGTFLGTMAELGQFNQSMRDKGLIGGVDNKPIRLAELEEQQSNLQRAAGLAMVDLAKADAGRARSLGSAVWGNVTTIVKADFDKFKDVRKAVTEMEAEAEVIRTQAGAIGGGSAAMRAADLEVELRQIRQQRDSSTVGLDKNDPRRAAAANLATAKEDAARAKAAADQRKAGFAEADRREGVRSQFRNMELEAMQHMVALGDKSKELDLERLRITEQTVQARKPLLDILRDENATAAEKAKATVGLQFLSAQEDIMKQAVGANGFRGATAPSDFSPLLTGKAQATREENSFDARLLAELQKQSKMWADAMKTFDSMRRFFDNPIVGDIFKGLFDATASAATAPPAQ